jgi:hypothetical protein
VHLSLFDGSSVTGVTLPITGTVVEAAPPPEPVDWNALAARVQAYHDATGLWVAPEDLPAPAPGPEPVDWNALAARAEANFESTGSWFV